MEFAALAMPFHYFFMLLNFEDYTWRGAIDICFISCILTRRKLE